MWYRWAGKADILRILNNDAALYQKVKDAVKEIPENKKSKYEYVVAKFIDQSPQNLSHYINKLFTLHDKYQMPLDTGSKQIILNKTPINDWFSFEQKVDELLGKKEFEKSQKIKKDNKETISNPVFNKENIVEIFPINSPADGMKFNAILPWQSSNPWCITWAANNQYYNYRTRQQATFYIIIDHTRPTTDRWYAVALDHLPHRYALTDLRNGPEYDATEYLEQLQENMKEAGDNRDIYALTPHKPLTKEEEHENEVLGETLDYEDFLNLDKESGIKDAQLKYIIRGHILDDDQFDLILNIPHLLKAYLQTGMPKPDSQIALLNQNTRTTYDREIDKTISSAKQMNQLNSLYKYANNNSEFVKKIIESGGDVGTGLSTLLNMGKSDFEFIQKLILEDKIRPPRPRSLSIDLQWIK